MNTHVFEDQAHLNGACLGSDGGGEVIVSTPVPISNPPPWFPVDAELWQEPGPLKLHWTARKIAIYLREAASHDHEIKALRSIRRICDDLGLSRRVVNKAIIKLQSWPSRRSRFIQSWDDKASTFILRPVDDQWIKVWRWFWELDAPDKLKDVLFFIQTQFEKKVDSKVILRCNKYGTKAPSILRCCHIGGTRKTRKEGNKSQKKVVGAVVKVLLKSGLLYGYKPATSRSPMLCGEPSGETIPSLQERYGVWKAYRREPSGTCAVNLAEQRREPSGTCAVNLAEQRREPTLSDPVSESVNQSPLPKPLFQTPLGSEAERLSAGGEEEEHKQGDTITHCSIEELPNIGPIDAVSPEDRLAPNIKNKKIQTIIHAVEELRPFLLVKSRMNYGLLAKQMEELLLGLKRKHSIDANEQDIIIALESQRFDGLKERSWGLLLSPDYVLIFAKEIQKAFKNRQAIRESERAQRLKAIKLTRDPDPALRLRAINCIADYEPETFWNYLLPTIESDPVDGNVLAALRVIGSRHTMIGTAGKQQIIEVCMARQSRGIDDPHGDIGYFISLLA